MDANKDMVLNDEAKSIDCFSRSPLYREIGDPSLVPSLPRFQTFEEKVGI